MEYVSNDYYAANQAADEPVMQPVVSPTDQPVREDPVGRNKYIFYPNTSLLWDFDILHRRMGHASETVLKRMLRDNLETGAKLTYQDVKHKHLSFCDACLQGGMKAFPNPPSVTDYQYSPMELLATDPVKFSPPDVHGNTWSIPFADKATVMVFVFFAKRKNQHVLVLSQMCDLAEKHGFIIKRIQSDFENLYAIDTNYAKFCSDHNIACSSAERFYRAPYWNS